MIKQYFNKTKVLKSMKKLILLCAIYSAAIYANEIALTEENKQYLKPIMEKVMGNNNTCFIKNIINKIDKTKKIVADKPLGKAFKLAQFKTDTEKALEEDNLKGIIEKIKNNELEININQGSNWKEKIKQSVLNFFRIFIGSGYSKIKNSQLINALKYKNPRGYNTFKEDDFKYIIQTEHKDNYIKKDDNTFNEAAIDTHNFLRDYKTYFNTAIAWAGVIISVSIFILAINPKPLHIFNEFEWREESAIKRGSLAGIGLLAGWGIPCFSGLLAKKRIVNKIKEYIENTLLSKENNKENNYKNIDNIIKTLNEAWDQLCKKNRENIIQSLDGLIEESENKKIIEKYVNLINENECLKNINGTNFEIITTIIPDINKLSETEKESLKKIIESKDEKDKIEDILGRLITNIKEKAEKPKDEKNEFLSTICTNILEKINKKQEHIKEYINLLMIKKDLIVEK